MTFSNILDNIQLAKYYSGMKIQVYDSWNILANNYCSPNSPLQYITHSIHAGWANQGPPDISVTDNPAYEQQRGCYGNLSALSSNPSSHQDNADCAVARPQRWQENHLGKRGHLAEGCWRLRRLRLLTARAIMKHLVYQTPTERWREEERKSDSATFWIIFLWFSIITKTQQRSLSGSNPLSTTTKSLSPQARFIRKQFGDTCGSLSRVSECLMSWYYPLAVKLSTAEDLWWKTESRRQRISLGRECFVFSAACQFTAAVTPNTGCFHPIVEQILSKLLKCGTENTN